MSVKDKLFKQSNIGQWWGKFGLAGSQIAIFVSGYTFIMVSVGAYTPISAFFEKQGYVLSFWLYIGVVIIPIIVAYFLAWKLLVRSFFKQWANQFWKESDDGLNKLIKQNEEIIRRLDKLEKK